LIFAEVAVADAAGGVLAHSVMVAGERWAKGRTLSAADVRRAAAAGVARLTIARLAADDVAENTAATRLGGALAGAGVTALDAAHGRVNLAAAQDGLLQFDAAMVAAVNAVDEALTLATPMQNARVRTGDIVATIKVIPYAVPGAALAAAVAAARHIAVAAFRPQRVVLIQTRLPGDSAKVVAKTTAVTRGRVDALGATLGNGGDCAHDAAVLAVVLGATSADIILIAGASATADRHDVIPAAIVAAGGSIDRLGMPVDPGNLLCLGMLNGRPVIGLPGCARSPKRNGFDWVLERLVAGLTVTGADIAAMGVGGLLAEAERPQPRAAAAVPSGPVGAVVLAAGRSTRMGPVNKLLADLGGRPLVTHILDTLAAAGLPPPAIVLGNMADAVRAAIGARPAVFVTAPDYASGLSRSLRAGIAAVPADWRAALVCLGDMPRVDGATIAALASVPGDNAIAVPVWAGKRGNPVLWARAHFAALARLDGDVGGKALLSEHADAVIEVAAPDDGVLADVDTPEALAALRAR